jgi:hypothetical protein
MIKYITCATAILALIGINSVAAIRSNNDSKWQHGLRKLYYSKGHEVTDVQTKCEQVIEGDPKKCIIVCVEITSVKNGDELVGEYSKVNQRECEAGWEHDGHGNDRYSKSSKSKGGKSDGQWKISRLYYINNTKGGGESGYSKSSKSSGVGDVGDRDATILKPSHGKWEAVSWPSGAVIIEGDKVSSSSTSSKSESANWSSGAGIVKEGCGSGKSDKSGCLEPEPEWPAWEEPEEEVVILSTGGSVAGGNIVGLESYRLFKNDINELRAEVSKLIEDSDRELIPKFLRLGFHDCVGGCDGCVDMTYPDNKGLQEPIDAIYPLVTKFKDRYSRADIWTMATLVSADLAVVDGRPHGYHFLMRYIGRTDCKGADAKGAGGPDIVMPTNDLTTHELLAFFKDEFDMDMDETVTIMGAHAVAVARRENVGFGNVDKEDGWVYNAHEYELNNRYYDMLIGDDMTWEMELVHNENGVPSRYQWYQEKGGEDERPIMTNTDMALARDLAGYMNVDKDGNQGAVSCAYKVEETESGGSTYTRRRSVQSKPVVCPVAHDTVAKMHEYKMDNELFLIDFEQVLEKMLNNGYDGGKKLTRIDP